MQLNQVTLRVRNLERSKQFYLLLGLKLVVDIPTYVRFVCPDGNSTFSLDASDEVIPGTAIIYFECEHLDNVVAELKGKGVQFALGPVDQPWRWREAYLEDPDGYVICLFHAGDIRLNPPWKVKS